MVNLPLPQQRTFAEFFAGIGLMRLGLEKQGWKIAFANDICPDKYEIHKLNADEVPTFTLATVSFPCNDLSLV